MVKNWHDERLKTSGHFYKRALKKLKPGDLLKIKSGLDFLWRASTTKDHFLLYVPLLENTVILVLKTCVLCGDFRLKCDKKITKNKKEFPAFYKNLRIYDIVTPLTPCIEILHGNDILYLECEFFAKCLKNNYLEIINA